MGPNPVWLGDLQEKEVRTQTHTEGRPCEDGGEDSHLHAQDRGSEGTSPPCSQIFSLWNRAEINLCCPSLPSFPVCGIYAEPSPIRTRLRAVSWPLGATSQVVGEATTSSLPLCSNEWALPNSELCSQL